MLIIETPIFTKLIVQLMPDDDYRHFQNYLNAIPDAGDVIQGSGGLRKIRWRLEGQGKRGGVRVIYYWIKASGQILMLYVYKKVKQADLTAAQIRVLKQIVQEELHEKR